MKYSEMSKEALEKAYCSEKENYEEIKSRGLKLDMSRGKPEKGQLDLCLDMLTVLKTPEDCIGEDGLDVRNYCLPTGISELKKLFAGIWGVREDEIITSGNSSLNFMYNTIADAMLLGFPESEKPWCKYDKIKFLCPAPGYDRHFTVCQHLGIDMITVPMLETGPDMDMIEDLVSKDETIKGIWCVPKYQNPTGITFSDDTVRRFAALKPAAKDFKIFWDNAYYLHDLYEKKDTLLNIHREAEKYGNENMIFEFFSTSKVTLAGAGVSFMASSKENIAMIAKRISKEGLGYDKVNQLRHFRYLKSESGVYEVMKKQAAILAPKFKAVVSTLDEELSEYGFAKWHDPNGGYFVSLDVMPGTAKRTWELCNNAGVTLTGAGATFPYGKDPENKNLRLAPSNVKCENVKPIIKVVSACARLAALEKLLSK